MIALLLCLISLTRRTFVYFSNKVFPTMESRSPSPGRKNQGDISSALDTLELSDSEEPFQDADEDALISDAAAAVTPALPKRRANSVIDSCGANDAFISPGHSTPRRTSSQPAVEVSPDQDYSDTPEPPQVPRQEQSLRRADAVDAHMQNVATDDDYDPGISPTITVTIPVKRDAACYNMSHQKRGKCVIFNHERFDNGFDARLGSTTDANRIKMTFDRLGFHIEIYNDLKHSDLMNTIEKLSQENHKDHDCICIFVLTHGLNNDLISASDVAYRSDTIWKPFTADRCTSLAGKPKMFFLQACRGDQLDGGVTVRANTERTETDSSVASYKIPTHADFLIAHSTVQGFLSWRNPEEGTWYVQCLCDTIDQHWGTTDLLRMLTITARRVATDYVSYDDRNPLKHEKKQVPSVTSMLIREIYFTPKTDAGESNA